MRTVDEWKKLLRAALKEALLARQKHDVAAIRSTLAAIDDAEAADISLAPPAQDGPIAGAVRGLGAGEVPRRALDGQAVRAIVEREIAERRSAAASYAGLGRDEEARTLTLQADRLAGFL